MILRGTYAGGLTRLGPKVRRILRLNLVGLYLLFLLCRNGEGSDFSPGPEGRLRLRAPALLRGRLALGGPQNTTKETPSDYRWASTYLEFVCVLHVPA